MLLLLIVVVVIIVLCCFKCYFLGLTNILQTNTTMLCGSKKPPRCIWYPQTWPGIPQGQLKPDTAIIIILIKIIIIDKIIMNVIITNGFVIISQQISLLSDWFQATQAMCSIGLIFLLLAFMFIFLYMFVHNVSISKSLLLKLFAFFSFMAGEQTKLESRMT